MGFWNTLFTGGGLTGKFMGALGADQVIYNDKINANNLKWARKDRQTQWIDTVKGMRDANINPALAYQSGTVSADISSQQANPEQTLNARGSIMNLLQQAGGIGKTGAEIKQINETTELTRQQQVSEQIRQDLDMANTFNQWAEGILKNKQANWYDKRQAIEYKQIAEQIANISSSTLLNKAKINSEVTLQGLHRAQEKYESERSRGFSYSASGPFGIGASYTGNNANPYGRKGEWREFKNTFNDGTHWEYVLE